MDSEVVNPRFVSNPATDDAEQPLDIVEYDIKSTPNDFNVATIASFMDSGAIHIPAFQRHYVWDMTRASRLIESLILGLPIPQTFWYEESPNRFLIVDGQQRLLTIYFFWKGRFPKKAARATLRSAASDGSTAMPDDILHDDGLFQSFKLRLPTPTDEPMHPLHGQTYKSLGDRQTQFNMRPIRNIILSQTAPSNDDSSVFEIFSRLNSGGVALRHQEIRASLFYGQLFDFLAEANLEVGWRRLAGIQPDPRMKDVETILRGFAMAEKADTYKPSLPKFLNQFAKERRNIDSRELDEYRAAFQGFVGSFDDSSADIFLSQTRRFSPTLYDSTFAAAYDFLRAGQSIDPESVVELRADHGFRASTESRAGDTSNVAARIAAARRIIRPT
jgi:hypothetical protein